MKGKGKGALLPAALLAFGWWYNGVVARLEKTNKERGFLAVLVCIGSAVTVAVITPIIGVGNALWVFAAFAASGLPMTLGSISRYIEERHISEQQIREMARMGKEVSNNDATTQGGRARLRGETRGTGGEGRKCVRLNGD